MPAVAFGADDGFLLYAPSSKQRGLLVVRALTETKGDTVSARLEIVRTEPLDFPASHIAVHQTLFPPPPVRSPALSVAFTPKANS